MCYFPPSLKEKQQANGDEKYDSDNSYDDNGDGDDKHSGRISELVRGEDWRERGSTADGIGLCM